MQYILCVIKGIIVLAGLGIGFIWGGCKLLLSIQNQENDRYRNTTSKKHQNYQNNTRISNTDTSSQPNS